MSRSEHNPLPPELQDVEHVLRSERVQPSGLELDELKLRVKARRLPVHPAKGSFMKSRIGIALVLVVGLLAFSAGGALAVSGVSSSGSAGQAQYEPPAQGVSPSSNIGATTPSQAAPAGQAQAQAPSQQGATSTRGTLPFTGYLAIPVLLIGLALLATGMVLRRRSHRSTS